MRCADVPGFEGLYRVYEDGRVFSLGRKSIGGSRGGPCVKYYKPKFLEPQSNGAGRQRVRVLLYDGAGHRAHHYVCDLVRAALGRETADALPDDLRKKRVRSRPEERAAA